MIPAGPLLPSLREAVLAASIANLCLLRVWARLLVLDPGRADYHFRIIAAAFFTFVGLTTLVTVVIVLARRSSPSPTATIARWLPLFALVAAVNGFRQYWMPEIRLPLFVAGVLTLLPLAVALFLPSWRSRLARASNLLVLVMAPLIPITLGSILWGATQAAMAQEKPADAVALPPVSSRPASTRVLWIIFDELDQRVVYDGRPPDLDLPALTRLRAESFAASRAYPPSRLQTTISIATLLTGKLVERADALGWSDYAITFRGGAAAVTWSRQASLFSRARQAGVDTGIVGWYIPYCRIFSGAVTQCASFITGYDFDTLDLSLPKLVAHQLLTALSTVPFAVRVVSPVPLATVRRSHIAAHLHVRDAALAAATDRRLGLVFVHWPVPHRPQIYNRASRKFTTADDGTYLDNVALADRSFGELRRAMEQSGTWETTTILISADHSWRMPWGSTENVDPRVPFVLKLAHTAEGFEYREPFNTVVTHDLIFALLQGQLSTAKDVSSWMDRQRATNAQARFEP